MYHVDSSNPFKITKVSEQLYYQGDLFDSLILARIEQSKRRIEKLGHKLENTTKRKRPQIRKKISLNKKRIKLLTENHPEEFI